MTGSREKHEEPEEICRAARKLTEGIPTGFWNHAAEFRDGRIRVTVKGSQPAQVSIDILRGEQEIPVFRAQMNEPGYPHRYNPGRWTRYLAEAADNVSRGGSEMFEPIDDSDVFPE